MLLKPRFFMLPSPLIVPCNFLKKGQVGCFWKCVLSYGRAYELSLAGLVRQLLGCLMAKGYGLNQRLELRGALFLKLGAFLLLSER